MENNKTPSIRFKGFTDPWEQRKLGEYVSITSGEAPSKFEEGTELYVKVDDLNYNDKYVVDTQNKVAEHSTVKRVTKGSVVFPKRGAAIMTNKVRILGIDSYMDTNMMALTSERLDSEFLYNIISKEGLYKIADTSTIPQINNKHIEPYEVKIPSLDEQRRIGVYFKQLDNLITLHQRKYNKLLNVKKSMLEKMFPKNGSNIPEIRFKGFTDPWEQRKLGELVDVCSGRDYKHLSEGTIPVYGTGGYMLSVNDALSYDRDAIGIGRKGTIDRPYILKAPFWTVDTLFYAIPREKVDLNFAFDIFQNIDWKKKDESTGVPSLSKTAINDIDVLAPKHDEQQIIGQFFAAIDNLITLHQRKPFLMKWRTSDANRNQTNRLVL